MSISMHSASVPIFTRMLGNLLTWFDKAEAHAAVKKFEPGVLLTTRLAPDMLSFTTQIQIACDTAKFGVSRIAGVEAPKFDDKEASFAELRERVRKTMDFVASVPASQIDGKEEAELIVPRRSGPVTWKAEAYLKNHVLPNFFFHLTTAYALLRHNGVDLGKSDFLGAP
jgi:uncharacterized protein